jgi:hypothetical protein
VSLPTVTVEAAFRTDPDVTNPVWEDISAYAMGLSITSGRQYELDTIQASTLTLKLKNDDRRFDPTYTRSPYYPYVLPMRKIRVSVTYAAVTYYLFTGYVERWPLQWDAPAWGSVTLTAVDGMAALENAVVTGTFAQATTGQRISDVLTAAAWASVDPGDRLLDARHVGARHDDEAVVRDPDDDPGHGDGDRAGGDGRSRRMTRRRCR